MKTKNTRFIALTLILLLMLFNIPIMNFAVTGSGPYTVIGNDGSGNVRFLDYSTDALFLDGSDYLKWKSDEPAIPGLVVIITGNSATITVSDPTLLIGYIYVKTGEVGAGPFDLKVENYTGNSGGLLYVFDSGLTVVNAPEQKDISHITIYYKIQEVTTTVPVTTTTTIPETTTTTIPETTTTTIPETTTTTIPETTTTTIPETTTTTIPETTTTTIPETTTTTIPETTTTTIPETTTTTIPETTTTTIPETTTTTTTTTTTREERETTTTTSEQTTTTTEDITETTGPLDVPEILEDIVPLGPVTLPKTGELPVSLFYGFGGLLTAVGLLIRRK